ncbi:MAG: hypothetical protein JO295_07910 [Verrucomicrobia bacterium]|nr:hypothetical protein [Verrucomicrobiota bacterium]
MSFYQESIVALLGCSAADAVMIEFIMREDIFHSTLDWQTRAQLDRAARQAARILAAGRADYEEYFAATRAQFMQWKAAEAAMANSVNYEI